MRSDLLTTLLGRVLCLSMSATDAMTAALERFVGGLGETAQFEDSWSSRDFDLEFLSEAVNSALYGADFVGALEELEVIERFLDHVRTAVVIACRSTGTSWDEIGEALGKNRQWAWRTYHRQADLSAELNDRTLTEFEQAIPDFAKWGFDVESMKPDERKAISLIERQAERAYERVRRALALTTDTHRRSLVKKEQEGRRATMPGRRPGPQRSAEGESS